jgi:purine-binding chemotaxis protein CheW
VIAPTTMTPLPQSAPHFRGLINLRGQVIPIVDLALKMKIAAAETREPALLIVEIEGALVGMLVDAVVEVASFPESEIEVSGDGAESHLAGVAKTTKKMILLLNLNRIVTKAEIPVLHSRSSNAA